MSTIKTDYNISTLNENNINQEIQKSLDTLIAISKTLQLINIALDDYENQNIAGKTVNKYQEDQNKVENILNLIEQYTFLLKQKRKIGTNIENDFPNAINNKLYKGNTYFHVS